jgi:hypothetical protein
MKFVKILFIITLISTIITASGCKSDTKGQTINAFSERMNALNEDYKMSPLGYIYDSDKKIVTRYRVPYDFRTAQQKIREAGLPERLAARLERGT